MNDPFTQLLELLDKTNDDKPKSYHCTKKSLATMFPKKFISLYLVDLKFLFRRCSWKVTKIYLQYAFMQARFET